MTEHLKVYLSRLNIDELDVVCEITGRPAYLGNVDIHHIQYQSQGTKEEVNTIENLISIRRELHDFIHDNPHYQWWIHLVHMNFLTVRKPYHECLYSQNDPIFLEIMDKIQIT